MTRFGVWGLGCNLFVFLLSLGGERWGAPLSGERWGVQRRPPLRGGRPPCLRGVGGAPCEDGEAWEGAER